MLQLFQLRYLAPNAENKIQPYKSQHRGDGTMKTELIYLWINKDENGCFQQEGFNFSPKYSVSYSIETKELEIKKRDTINVFQSENIANVTAIIGENGTGKTTLLEFLTGLFCAPLSEDKQEEYKAYNEKQNELNMFIAVYVEPDNKEFRIINITNDIIFLHEPIATHTREIKPYRINGPQHEDYIGNISHIYLSNSAYKSSHNQNMRSNGTVNHITLTDATLSTISYDFYRKKYGFPTQTFSIPNTPFNALAGTFAAQESNQSMQMFFDLLFYIFLKENSRSFLGKSKDTILISIKSAWKKICTNRKSISIETNYAKEEYIKSVESRYNSLVQRISGRGLWLTIVYNLVFELLFVFEEYAKVLPSDGEYDADHIFSISQEFIHDLREEGKEKKYYEEAIEEISLVKDILIGAEYVDNLLPASDKGREVFAQIDVLKLVPLINHMKEKHSFLLKYLDIRNFEISSGERALLNLMSRLHISSQINEFIPNSGFKWNTSVLLLIDEIDLYLHPEWQRQILHDLLKAIQEAFPENYVQLIITSHSPIILSDIPKENSIFLQRDVGKTVQVKHDVQTFGGNIHTLYKDAFFIKDGLAMGSFAREMINTWIEDIKAGKKDANDIHKILLLIGEPLIRKRLERIIQDGGINTVKEKIRPDERERILKFLRTQKDAIQQQIDALEAQEND